uniref:Uncharacterized protein n=1 Tax=Romanomermis culicivorax TaxID=13658 RepID=A0A915IKG7_ROMCU
MKRRASITAASKEAGSTFQAGKAHLASLPTSATNGVTDSPGSWEPATCCSYFISIWRLSGNLARNGLHIQRFYFFLLLCIDYDAKATVKEE